MSEGMNINEYLENPEKWQTFSHPDLAKRKPEELFAADFVERYYHLHHNLWQRIIRTHETLYTLEQLRSFPFDYLYVPNGMEFWFLVFDNFYDMSCILLHGLCSDKSQNAHTIPRFRDEISQEPWLDTRQRDLFRQTLAERRFDSSIERITKRVKEIRNKRIAHHDVNWHNENRQQVANISLDDLKKLYYATQLLFGALSFGTSHATLTDDFLPGTVGGKPKRTCLDEVLDAIVKDSNIVNEPERMAHCWPMLRQCKDSEELAVMNMLRERIGLPEA